MHLWSSAARSGNEESAVVQFQDIASLFLNQHTSFGYDNMQHDDYCVLTCYHNHESKLLFTLPGVIPNLGRICLNNQNNLVFGKLAKWVMKHWKCWNKKGPNSINVVFGLKRGVTDQDKSIKGEIDIFLWQDNVCTGRKSFQQQLSDSGTPQGSIFSPIPFSLHPFFITAYSALTVARPAIVNGTHSERVLIFLVTTVLLAGVCSYFESSHFWPHQGLSLSGHAFKKRPSKVAFTLQDAMWFQQRYSLMSLHVYTQLIVWASFVHIP